MFVLFLFWFARHRHTTIIVGPGRLRSTQDRLHTPIKNSSTIYYNFKSATVWKIINLDKHL